MNTNPTRNPNWTINNTTLVAALIGIVVGCLIGVHGYRAGMTHAINEQAFAKLSTGLFTCTVDSVTHGTLTHISNPAVTFSFKITPNGIVIESGLDSSLEPHRPELAELAERCLLNGGTWSNNHSTGNSTSGAN